MSLLHKVCLDHNRTIRGLFLSPPISDTAQFAHQSRSDCMPPMKPNRLKDCPHLSIDRWTNCGAVSMGLHMQVILPILRKRTRKFGLKAELLSWPRTSSDSFEISKNSPKHTTPFPSLSNNQSNRVHRQLYYQLRSLSDPLEYYLLQALRSNQKGSSKIQPNSAPRSGRRNLLQSFTSMRREFYQSAVNSVDIVPRSHRWMTKLLTQA